jgi:transcriptional regulator with XRE-family HTH domain
VAKRRETFADRLTALREAAGVTMYRLAQLSGLSKQAISRLENGETRPAWDTVLALARALGVSVEAFVVELPEAPPPPEPKRRGRKPKAK